jgi:hypothetical protein
LSSLLFPTQNPKTYGELGLLCARFKWAEESFDLPGYISSSRKN